MFLKKAIGLWVCVGFGIILAVMISKSWFDIPIARMFAGNIDRFGPLGSGLGSAVLISGELLIMAILIAVRVASGHLPYWGKTLLVAVAASLIAFAANDFVLKIVFGIPNPTSLLFYGANHKFNFLRGNQQSSFPSGHMALAVSFVFAFVRLYRKALAPLFAALLVVGVLLILGDWHFLSDVLAGAFVGATAGLAAGELWIQHNKRPNA